MDIAESVEVTRVWSPRARQASMACRAGTTDLATVGSVFNLWGHLADEYGLQAITVDTVAIDVGAHIGAVSIAILLDNPEARVIAVEPLPENVDMIRRNARLNGVEDRLRIMVGAVGDGIPTTIRYGDAVNRYIGDIRSANGPSITVPTYRLRALIDEALDFAGTMDVQLLKTDCEGGEWALFEGALPGELRSIARMVGEYHTLGPEHLEELLGATHELVTTPQGDGTGLFTAVRR